MALTLTQLRDKIETKVNHNPVMAFQNNIMKDILISLLDQHEDLIIGAGGEPTIDAGTTAQYWRGDKTWQTLNKTAVGLSNVQNVDQTVASNLTSGSIPAGRYGALTIPVSAINATGTADNTTVLFGDGTWGTVNVTDGNKGHITVAGASWTINDDAITLDMLPEISANRVLGRTSSGVGDIEELTGSQITGLLDIFTSTTPGIVDASGGGTVNFLRADGEWAPPGTGATLADGVYDDIEVSSGGTLLTVVANAITNSKINDVAWGKLTGVPTTVAGYGITDAVTLTGTETLTNKTLTAPVINVGSDATGDIYYRNASGILTRLPVGTNGHVLTLAAGLPGWAAGGSSFTTEDAQDAVGAMINSTLTYTDATPLLSINLGNANTWTADQSVPDEAYGVGWDGSMEVPTKNAVYDKIETISSGSLPAQATHAARMLTTNGITASWGNVLGYWNVKTFGAVGDGVTDDTVAIQATIAACFNAGGGVVYFPNGIYIIGGALQTSVDGENPNCQLYIPMKETSNDEPITIKFLGETPPEFNETVYGVAGLVVSGAILYSTIDGSGTYPSIVGTKGVTASFSGIDYSFSFVDLYVENLTLRVKANIEDDGPTMCGINAEWAVNSTFINVRCDIDEPAANSVSPTAVTFGIKNTHTNGGTQIYLANCISIGYKYGFVVGEHTYGENLSAFLCETGINFTFANHPVKITRFLAQWCKNWVGATLEDTYGLGTGVVLDIDQLDGEWINHATPKWYDSTYIINDPGNKITGNIYYNSLTGSGSFTNFSFTKNGGANLSAFNNSTRIGRVTWSHDTIPEINLKAYSGAGTNFRIGLPYSGGNLGIQRDNESNGHTIVEIIPKGAGSTVGSSQLMGILQMFGTDHRADQTNYHQLGVAAWNNKYTIAGVAAGTQTVKPIHLDATSGAYPNYDQLVLETSGTVAINVSLRIFNDGSMRNTNFAGNGTGVMGVDNDGDFFWTAGSQWDDNASGIDFAGGSVGVGTTTPLVVEGQTLTSGKVINVKASVGYGRGIFQGASGGVMELTDNGATVDQKRWQFRSDNGLGSLEVVKDDGTSITVSLMGFNLANGAISFGGSYGTSGQVLTSGGSGAAPTWTTAGDMILNATNTMGTSGKIIFPANTTAGNSQFRVAGLEVHGLNANNAVITTNLYYDGGGFKYRTGSAAGTLISMLTNTISLDAYPGGTADAFGAAGARFKVHATNGASLQSNETTFYLNFNTVGATDGSGAWGFRSNSGIMEVKNTSGTWKPIAPLVFTPANSTDATYANGTIAADDTFIYYRTSSGTWKKVALATF